MAGKYVENESYKHKIAKELLASWLKSEENTNDSCSFCGFSWRKNYGIFTELPFYEHSHPYYYEQGTNTGKILFVPDITVFHKGQAFYLIEVVHRSPPDQEKLFKIFEFFYPHHFELHTIKADNILNNTGLPTFLATERLL